MLAIGLKSHPHPKTENEKIFTPINIKTKDIIDNGADQFQSIIFEAMASEEPELYKKVKKFIKSKQDGEEK